MRPIGRAWRKQMAQTREMALLVLKVGPREMLSDDDTAICDTMKRLLHKRIDPLTPQARRAFYLSLIPKDVPERSHVADHLLAIGWPND